jgi:hypothetical protein
MYSEQAFDDTSAGRALLNTMEGFSTVPLVACGKGMRVAHVQVCAVKAILFIPNMELPVTGSSA